MNIGYRALTMLIAAGTIAGCKDATKPEDDVQVNGEYVGSVTTGGQSASMTINATETSVGAPVSGTYSIAAPISESGTISGNFLGLILNLTFTRTSPSAATFASSVDLSNGSTKLVGTFGSGLYSYNLTQQ